MTPRSEECSSEVHVARHLDGIDRSQAAVGSDEALLEHVTTGMRRVLDRGAGGRFDSARRAPGRSAAARSLFPSS